MIEAGKKKGQASDVSWPKPRRGKGPSGDAARKCSPPGGEKVAQQRRCVRLADAAVDLRPVQAGGGGEVAHAVLDRAAFRICGAVIEAADARERDRRRAHRAGLERDVEIAVNEPLAA